MNALTQSRTSTSCMVSRGGERWPPRTIDDVAMAVAVSTVAPATAEGRAHFRDGFHHCTRSVGCHGSLDHSVAFGTFSSGSSPGWIRLRGLTFAPWVEVAPWVEPA